MFRGRAKSRQFESSVAAKSLVAIGASFVAMKKKYQRRSFTEDAEQRRAGNVRQSYRAGDAQARRGDQVAQGDRCLCCEGLAQRRELLQGTESSGRCH